MDETSGNFKHTLRHLMWPPNEHDAQALRKATKKSADNAVLIEVLCTKNRQELIKAKRTYETCK